MPEVESAQITGLDGIDVVLVFKTPRGRMVGSYWPNEDMKPGQHQAAFDYLQRKYGIQHLVRRQTPIPPGIRKALRDLP